MTRIPETRYIYTRNGLWDLSDSSAFRRVYKETSCESEHSLYHAIIMRFPTYMYMCVSRLVPYVGIHVLGDWRLILRALCCRSLYPAVVEDLKRQRSELQYSDPLSGHTGAITALSFNRVR